MKIDLSKIDTEHFNVKSGVIASEECFLVTPKLLSTPWNKDNIIFRSSIWNKDGEPVSLSFKKFTNWGEREDLFPLPNSLTNTTAVTKIDGSALIVSKYKGQLITRTRGTFDVSSLENGAEIELLKEKYPMVFKQDQWAIDTFGESDTWPLSYIYEWTTPTQKIVLDYGNEPQLHLIGIVRHEDYSLSPQKSLDFVAISFNVKRPESHLFTDIKDMVSTIKKWQGLEGICLYSKDGQEIHKIKAEQYLLLHHFKSNATLNNVLERFFEYDCPGVETFKNKLLEQFDYECWKLVEELVVKVNISYVIAKAAEEKIKIDVDKLKDLSQKDFALKNLAENKEYASLYFEIRAKGELSKKSIRKLMEMDLNK
jgi:hypothetical protein